MTWINSNFQHIVMRESDYNRSVCLNKTNLDKLTAMFDNIFNGLFNFTEEIASLQLYPLKIRPYLNPTGVNVLSTTRGVFNNINVYKVDYSAYYVTLGQYYVQPKFKNFADYKGYTQIKLYLPQMGFVDVDVNECMGKWLQFRLAIDFHTGKGLYIIGVSDGPMYPSQHSYPVLGDEEGLRIISTFECTIGIEIPLGSSNIGDIKRNVALGTVKTLAGVGVASYVGGLEAATTTSSTVKTYDVYGRSKAKGSRMKQIKGGTETTTKTTVHNKPVDKSKPIAEAINGSIDVLNNLTIHGTGDRVNESNLLWRKIGRAHV